MSATVIGVDLGPTRVRFASLRGTLGEPLVRPTERSETGALIDQLTELIDLVGGDDIAAVGIAVPRVVEFQTGSVIPTSRPAAPGRNGAFDLPLAGVPVRALLGERLGVPVFLDNDANAAALAEAHDEKLDLVTEHLVMFTIGTTVGGGLVLGGRIYR